MKTFKLKKKDAHDLAAVMATIVREQSEKLDFKEVLHVQKSVNEITSKIQDFADKFDSISKERSQFVETANKKISAFKQKLMKESDGSGELDEKYKEKLDNYLQVVMDETTAEIEKMVSPMTNELYDGIGEDEVEIELDDEKMKMVVINFEKFAKEKYTNKSKMVEVYETLTTAS